MRPPTLGTRLVTAIALAGVPAAVVALVALHRLGATAVTLAWAAAVLAASMAAAVRLARTSVERPLQTFANLISALREQDYSFRARGRRPDDPLGEIASELNRLADLLKTQRLGALEATALLRTVLREIDVAVFAFDEDDRVRLVNRAGERAVGRPAEQVIGRGAADLGLEDVLRGDSPRVVDALFGGRPERWSVRRSAIRQLGRPHRLLVLTDVSRALRDEERQAWQRLVRVLGHEINNSLAPIKSIAASLRGLVQRDPAPPDLGDDLARGFEIIEQRAAALARFTQAYAQIARLPPPSPARVPVAELAHRVARLLPPGTVVVEPGPAVAFASDPVQTEQALINLVRNAADATAGEPGSVHVRWAATGRVVTLAIEDAGPGLAPTANLFVPFFTTKPGGTGIGLALSRLIAEQNGGRLRLENRDDGPGARATLDLPQAE